MLVRRLALNGGRFVQKTQSVSAFPITFRGQSRSVHLTSSTASAGNDAITAVAVTRCDDQSPSSPTSPSAPLLRGIGRADKNNAINNARSFSSSASPSSLSSSAEERRRSILTSALRRVHDEGWTDDAVAFGTLDAGFPPSYIGRASSASSAFGNADLVAFFMDECNDDLRRELRGSGNEESNADGSDLAARICRALKLRLGMTVPFVASRKWHEGMAIGALPQNAYRTARQLDEMAGIVLDYAKMTTGGGSAAERAAVVAAYAAAELHLLVDESGGDLNGDRYRETWSLLVRCSSDAARLIEGGSGLSLPMLGPLSLQLPSPTSLVAASAVASSLAGAAMSLAAPAAAAMAGQAIPLAMSALEPLQGAIFGAGVGNVAPSGIRPSDYEDDVSFPPFDSSEEIFPKNGEKLP